MAAGDRDSISCTYHVQLPPLKRVCISLKCEREIGLKAIMHAGVADLSGASPIHEQILRGRSLRPCGPAMYNYFLVVAQVSDPPHIFRASRARGIRGLLT